MKYAIVLLALAGVWVSARALQIHYSTASQPCSINDVWDCGVVNHSKYSVLFGVPVALIGIVGYGALVVTAALKAFRLMAAGALAGVGFAVYLAYIEKNVLGAWCQYCVASLIIITIIAVLALMQLTRGSRPRRTETA
jgi:uncharacterized membrane protein